MGERAERRRAGVVSNPVAGLTYAKPTVAV